MGSLNILPVQPWWLFGVSSFVSKSCSYRFWAKKSTYPIVISSAPAFWNTTCPIVISVAPQLMPEDGPDLLSNSSVEGVFCRHVTGNEDLSVSLCNSVLFTCVSGFAYTLKVFWYLVSIDKIQQFVFKSRFQRFKLILDCKQYWRGSSCQATSTRPQKYYTQSMAI